MILLHVKGSDKVELDEMSDRYWPISGGLSTTSIPFHSKTHLFCNIESTTTVHWTHSRIRAEGVKVQQVFEGLSVKFAHFVCARLVYINSVAERDSRRNHCLCLLSSFSFSFFCPWCSEPSLLLKNESRPYFKSAWTGCDGSTLYKISLKISFCLSKWIFLVVCLKLP